MTIPGGRKFSAVMTALVFAFVLALLQRLTSEFAQVVSVCVASFMGAHMVQDFRSRAGTSTTTTSTTTSKGQEPPT